MNVAIAPISLYSQPGIPVYYLKGETTSDFRNVFISDLCRGALRDGLNESAMLCVIKVWECPLKIDEGEGVRPLRPFVCLILVASGRNRG